MNETAHLIVEPSNNKTSIFENELGTSYGKFINETLISLSQNNENALFGNIVILAGGDYSGKGFILKNLLDIEGKTFDVDKLKSLALMSDSVARLVRDKFNVDITKLDLKKPKDVSDLHRYIYEIGLEDKLKQTMFNEIVMLPPEKKPNLIFDVTLSEIAKFYQITDSAKSLGYDLKKVHLVWVVNDVKVAIKQNKNRDRVVPEDVLLSTHDGVTNVISNILAMKSVREYIDGKIIFAFNNAELSDTEITSTDKKANVAFNKSAKSFYIKKANYVTVKDVGKMPISYEQMGVKVLEKIVSYLPDRSSKISWEKQLLKLKHNS